MSAFCAICRTSIEAVDVFIILGLYCNILGGKSSIFGHVLQGRTCSQIHFFFKC